MSQHHHAHHAHHAHHPHHHGHHPAPTVNGHATPSLMRLSAMQRLAGACGLSLILLALLVWCLDPVSM